MVATFYDIYRKNDSPDIIMRRGKIFQRKKGRDGF
jgi:hypothetical protein